MRLLEEEGQEGKARESQFKKCKGIREQGLDQYLRALTLTPCSSRPRTAFLHSSHGVDFRTSANFSVLVNPLTQMKHTHHFFSLLRFRGTPHPRGPVRRQRGSKTLRACHPGRKPGTRRGLADQQSLGIQLVPPPFLKDPLEIVWPDPFPPRKETGPERGSDLALTSTEHSRQGPEPWGSE